MGTNTVVYVEYDGRERTMIVGPAAPHPDWLPVIPGSLTVSAASWPLEPETGTHDALVHARADEVVRFYRDRLANAAFEVTSPASRPEDALLGVTRSLLARNDKTEIRVLVRAHENPLHPARIVQLNRYPKR